MELPGYKLELPGAILIVGVYLLVNTTTNKEIK
jgi:hypothetical protein